VGQKSETHTVCQQTVLKYVPLKLFCQIECNTCSITQEYSSLGYYHILKYFYWLNIPCIMSHFAPDAKLRHVHFLLTYT